MVRCATGCTRSGCAVCLVCMVSFMSPHSAALACPGVRVRVRVRARVRARRIRVRVWVRVRVRMRVRVRGGGAYGQAGAAPHEAHEGRALLGREPGEM